MYCVNITQYIRISHYLLGNDMSLMHLWEVLLSFAYKVTPVFCVASSKEMPYIRVYTVCILHVLRYDEKYSGAKLLQQCGLVQFLLSP